MSADADRAMLQARVDAARARVDRPTSTRWDLTRLEHAERALAAHDAETRAAAARRACRGFYPGDVLARYGGRRCQTCGVSEGAHWGPAL